MVYPIGSIFRSIVTFPVKQVEGLENFPKDTPFVIASNHTSFIDPLVLLIITKHIKKRKIYFISAMLLFFDLIANFFFMEWGGSIRLKKHGGFLKSALKQLRKGNIIGIFPEGMPNKKPNLRKGKTGVARLVLKSKVPVVPINIRGSLYVWSRLKWIPSPKKEIVIKIGNPIYFEKYYGKEDDYSVLRKVTRIIMKEIAKLGGQKYEF